ncbi:hypothetical protein [Streptomyces sp. NPDC058249]|uniref:hypothetical protein n=1 Tax=Streptomyces sp. NPDC058249 TaxID=3346403 RepID=UPI0036E37E02
MKPPGNRADPASPDDAEQRTEHTRLRTHVMRAFAPRRTAALRPRIERIAQRVGFAGDGTYPVGLPVRF